MPARPPYALPALSLITVAVLTACGGGGGGSTAPDAAQTPASQSPVASPTVALNGSVAAPGGALAFNPADGILIRLARWVMPDAVAAAPSGSFTGVGAGVTVSLIEIDANGAQVGSALAEALTAADGRYTLAAPAGFVPSARFVVRARATSGTLDAVVTGTTVDVDPTTDVTKTLVLVAAAGASDGLAALGVDEVATLQKEVVALTADSTLRFTSASDAITQLRTLANASQELANMVASTAAAGVVSGIVKDPAGQPMAGVKVVVADYGNWVTRSVAYTDAQGRYTLNAPTGDFILGAINPTTVAAASEWWTADGTGAANKFDAAKISVGTTPVTGDFQLKQGVTLSGTVTGDGVGLGGVQVMLRDFVADTPVAGMITASDGSWRVNVRPGLYTLAAVNMTGQPYASQYYGANGAAALLSAAAAPISVASAPLQADFALAAGHRIEGRITDPVDGPVTGFVVRFFDAPAPDTSGAFVNAIRTDLAGSYRFWLPPKSSYLVRARGQSLTVDTSTADRIDADFAAAVARYRGTVTDSLGRPVSQAKLSLYASASPYAFVGSEVSNSDGSFEVYATQTSTFLEAKIDGGATNGTLLFGDAVNGTTYGTVTASPYVVAPGAVRDLGPLTLPVGGVLGGTVTIGGAPRGNYVIQVRASVSPALGASAFTATRTSSDGSYSLSLPYGTYSIRACNPGVTCTAYSQVTIGGASATKSYAL